MKTYRNGKTNQARASDGSFRQWTGADAGIGVCPKCSHLTLIPPEPAAFKSGHIAPEHFRQWQKARVCGHCGWKNEEAEAMPMEAPASTILASTPISPLKRLFDELSSGK